jgi:hypothetical protein
MIPFQDVSYACGIIQFLNVRLFFTSHSVTKLLTDNHSLKIESCFKEELSSPTELCYIKKKAKKQLFYLGSKKLITKKFKLTILLLIDTI